METGQFRQRSVLSPECDPHPGAHCGSGRKTSPLLVENFIRQLNRNQLGMVIEGVGPGSMELLMDYDWPGNVRELQKCGGERHERGRLSHPAAEGFLPAGQRLQARKRRQVTSSGTSACALPARRLNGIYPGCAGCCQREPPRPPDCWGFPASAL